MEKFYFILFIGNSWENLTQGQFKWMNQVCCILWWNKSAKMPVVGPVSCLLAFALHQLRSTDLHKLYQCWSRCFKAALQLALLRGPHQMVVWSIGSSDGPNVVAVHHCPYISFVVPPTWDGLTWDLKIWAGIQAALRTLIISIYVQYGHDADVQSGGGGCHHGVSYLDTFITWHISD